MEWFLDSAATREGGRQSNYSAFIVLFLDLSMRAPHSPQNLTGKGFS